MVDAEEICGCAPFSAFETREVVLSVAGPVTIHRPVTGAPRGEVILLPGWSGPRSGPADILAFLASKLAEAGWTAYRVDLPGRGDAKATGEADLDAMIASAANVTSARQGSNRALVGICSGGNVALGAAPLEACASIQRVVAISTFPFQPARTKTFDRRRRWKNIKNYARKAISPTTWLRLFRGEINVDRVKKNVAGSETPAGEKNLKDSARDIENELRAWKGEALFVWGGGDEEGQPARTHYEKLHAQGMGKRARFHTVSGANHNFYGRAWREELLREVLSFLDEK